MHHQKVVHGDTVTAPSQILCLSVSSLNTDRGLVEQVSSPVLDMVAGCAAVVSSCFEQRRLLLELNRCSSVCGILCEYW